MNALVNLNNQLTMTSKEIADLVESRHDSVKRTIERLSTSVISKPPLVDGEKSANGVVEKIYVFSGEKGKRDSIIVVAQLCPEFTARLVDRWQELESQVSTHEIHLPKSFAEALRLAADQAEQIEQQQLLIEQQKPAVEFVGKYVTASSGNMTFRATAKILNINEREFRTFLRDNKIMYLLGGDWVPYQAHIEAGRFEIKAGLAEHDEKSHAFKQSKFTPKGVEWVAGEYAKHMTSKALKSQEEAA